MEPDELWLLPPAEFVAARNQVVRELRRQGDRERASEVSGWRRPAVIDWALNRLAHDDGDAVQSFVSAARAASQAQAAAAAGHAADLRRSLADLRDASALLVTAAMAVVEQAGVTGASAAGVAARLRHVATDTTLLTDLAAGRLGQHEPGDTGPFEGVEGAPVRAARARPAPPTAPPTPSPKAKTPRSPAAPERTSPRPDGREVAKLRRAVVAAQAATDAAARRVKAKEAALGRARDAVQQAEAELAAAQTGEVEAQAALAAAQAELAELTAH